MAKVVYDIITKTGLNGLNSPVVIELYGEGNSGTVKFTLDEKDRDDFRAGAADIFEMTGDKDIGKIQEASIVSGPSGDDHWDLDWIYVLNHGTKSKQGQLLSFNEGGYHPITQTIKKCPATVGFLR